MAEQSRTEEILRATIDGDEYTKTPQSREEELLLELKQTIEAGSGGASVVPNPEGEATETLTKLGVNNTVYGIPKELPDVTSADAGDILGVNSEGLWEKIAPNTSVVIFNATKSYNSSQHTVTLTLLDGFRVGALKNVFSEGKLAIIKTQDDFYYPSEVNTSTYGTVRYSKINTSPSLDFIELFHVYSSDNTSTVLSGRYRAYTLP